MTILLSDAQRSLLRELAGGAELAELLEDWAHVAGEPIANVVTQLRARGLIEREPWLTQAEQATHMLQISRCVAAARESLQPGPDGSTKWRVALDLLRRAAELEAEIAATCERITVAGRDAVRE